MSIQNNELRRPRVLVIDDEPSIGQIIKRALEAEYEVLVLTDPELALGLLHSDQSVDVILCDIMMPKFSGMDVYQEVQRFSPVTANRMVFMTGGIVSTELKDFFNDIPNLRLDKPFSNQEIRTFVQQLIF